jgi:hypothetical protein
MADDDLNESKPFPGPMVRVRGRVWRKGNVTWSPAIRTFRGRDKESTNQRRIASPPTGTRQALATTGDQHLVEILDYEGTALISRPVHLNFFSSDQEFATFSTRLPFEPNGEQLQLRVGERVLSTLKVPTERPYFTLLHPDEDDYIDPNGVLHLHWAAHSSEDPLTYFVRYTADGGHTWLRPGVDLQTTDFYLDLREMPGGQRCRAEVLATNGYRTAYARTRWFDVPRKVPTLLLGETVGPILYGQGYSKEQGALPVQWRADDGTVIATGTSCDVRLPVAGTRRVSANVTDVTGLSTSVKIGEYDNLSGKVVQPIAGY